MPPSYPTGWRVVIEPNIEGFAVQGSITRMFDHAYVNRGHL